jgi:multiple sugar transport system ATP-binding protein
MTMADKIVVLNAGRIEQVGSPLELYDRPRNLFVATFIGSPEMNRLSGTARADGSIEVAGVSLGVAGGHAAADGQAVVYGIRPEHLELADTGLPARVAIVEPTGAATQVHLRLDTTDLVAVFHDRHAFRPGQVVHLRPRPEHAHVFDAATGIRL